MPQASRAAAKDADDRPRNIVLGFSPAAFEFESASGLEPITDGHAGRARHARTDGRKSHGPRVGVISVSVKALRSMREAVPVVGIDIEIGHAQDPAAKCKRVQPTEIQA